MCIVFVIVFVLYLYCNCICMCIVFVLELYLFRNYIYCVQYVSFIIFVTVCAVFCLSVVCYFVWCVLFCVLCLIVVPLPPGSHPLAVKINNNKIIIILVVYLCFTMYWGLTVSVRKVETVLIYVWYFNVALKMEAVCSLGTLVSIYQIILARFHYPGDVQYEPTNAT
jgi:hypothetical protein